MPSRRVGRAGGGVLAALLAAALATGMVIAAAAWVPGADRPGAAEPAVAPQYPEVDGRSDGADRPNVVFVLTDDQNTDELAWMPHVQRLLVDQGVSFTGNVSPHPLCCPARAELVSGEYAQNNGVQHNSGPHGAYQALRDDAPRVSERLQDAGYRTGLVGKYLNGYNGTGGPGGPARERGWDAWQPLVSSVYQYDRYGFIGDRRAWRRDFTPYVTDAIARRSEAELRRMVAGDQPFALWSWHVAPHYRPAGNGVHAPPPAAARDAGKLGDVPAPSLSKPSYNQTDVSDQPQDIRRRPIMSDAKNQRMFTGRIRSLQAVDRSVASLVRILREAGELDDTYVVFSSDNGYAMGEHRLFGKNVLTQEILDVPLVVRGPGIEPGTTSELPTSLVDLPATMLDLAGADDRDGMDGASLVGPMLGQRTTFRDTTLVQTGDAAGDGWKYRGVRTERYLYGRDDDAGDAFLYDHATDPWELANVVDDPRYSAVVDELEGRAQRLRTCEGPECNLVFGPDPAPAD